jgi:hypothetical protein
MCVFLITAMPRESIELFWTQISGSIHACVGRSVGPHICEKVYGTTIDLCEHSSGDIVFIHFKLLVALLVYGVFSGKCIKRTASEAHSCYPYTEHLTMDDSEKVATFSDLPLVQESLQTSLQLEVCCKFDTTVLRLPLGSYRLMRKTGSNIVSTSKMLRTTNLLSVLALNHSPANLEHASQQGAKSLQQQCYTKLWTRLNHFK